MRAIRLLGVLILLLFLSACGDEKKIEPAYLDVSAYQGDRQEVLKMVNKRVEYFNNRDNKLYPTIFTADSSQNDIGAYKGIDTKIIAVSNPRWLGESEHQVTVYIREEYKDSPNGEFGDTMYTLFKQEDGSWLIDNLD